MRTRALLLGLALVVAGRAEPTSEASGGGDLLRYGYQPGDNLVYDARQQMQMVVTGEDDDAFAAAFDAEMQMDLSTRLEYGFAEGPEPDMVAITVATTFLGGSATVTQLGIAQPIPMDELTGLGTIETTIVVDPNGRPVEITIDGETVPLDLFGDLQGLGGLGGLATPQHMGPEFPGEPVAVGDSWETEANHNLMGLDLRQRAEHEIVGEEVIDGRSTLKVVSRITTEGMEFDLADLTGLSLAAAGDLTPTERQQMEMAIEMFEAMGVEMRYAIEDTEVLMASWFDPVEGVVVQLAMEAPMTIAVEISNMPDLPSGDVRMLAEMDISQTMRLAG